MAEAHARAPGRRSGSAPQAAMEIVVRGLRDLYLACVAPCWPRIEATFRALLNGNLNAH